MERRNWRTRFAGTITTAVLVAISLFSISNVSAGMVDGKRVIDAENEPGNWMTCHGTYKSWHYSPLGKINIGNVSNLQGAWSHVVSRANRGLRGFPLPIDGVVYYSSPYDQVYALDGSTGTMLWTYKQKLDEHFDCTTDTFALQPWNCRWIRQHVIRYAGWQARRDRYKNCQAQLGNQVD